MKKFTRNERVLLIMKKLTENPMKLISLTYFSNYFSAAKSTISEDLLIVREALEKTGLGKVETLAGASGGVRYLVDIKKETIDEFKEELLTLLEDKSRIVPGNFLYMTDIMQNPQIVSRAGAILAKKLSHLKTDYIITVETKGIPLAYEVARFMGVNLIVVRRNTKVTEGTNVSINYLSGNQGLLSTMSLSKRAIKPHSNLIFIDDFLRGGGTIKGIIDLLAEFECELTGGGVIVESKDIEKSLPIPVINFVDYFGLNEGGSLKIKGSDSI